MFVGGDNPLCCSLPCLTLGGTLMVLMVFGQGNQLSGMTFVSAPLCLLNGNGTGGCEMTFGVAAMGWCIKHLL